MRFPLVDITPTATTSEQDRAIILVVEDNPVERQLVSKILRNAGFEVVAVDCGGVVLETMEAYQPDLVLLDALLPDIDGFDVCRELRLHPKGYYLPILMLTGLDDVDSINRAYEVGSTDFFTKPINHNMLIHRIRYHLRSRAMMDKLRVSTQSLENAQLIAKLGYWEYDFGRERFTITNEMFSLYELGKGCSPDDKALLDKHCHPDDKEWVEATVARAIKQRKEARIEHRFVTPRGQVHYIELHLNLMRDERNNESHMLGLGVDITARKESEKEILRLAYFDRLTRLPNRSLLEPMLDQAIPRAHVSGKCVAVMVLDLDMFSRINNSMGHAAGDEVLLQLAERLKLMFKVAAPDVVLENLSTTKETINSGDSEIIGRIASDTFIAILPLADRQSHQVADFAAKIKSSFQQAFIYRGQELFVTASIGYAYSESGGSSAETIIQQADLALHEAKAEGRNEIRQYSGDLVAKVSNHLSIQGDLRRALDTNEFELFYQPKISTVDQSICGFEALVRWFHPVKGMVPPDQFISVAEDTGQIVELGTWVLETACVQAKHWLDEGLIDAKMAVNVAARQFKEKNITDLVRKILQRTGLPASNLELEMTEGVLMADPNISSIVEVLRSEGVSIALDDFGTGYSSLSYITRFPIDTIKIDRCFVQNITLGSDKAAIVTAVTNLSHTLNFNVVAEGVENEEELAVIKALGCDEVQGYHYCRPMSAGDITEWIKNRQKKPLPLSSSN
ncbi:EAL domain-containing protein [Dasania marina]|uniref:putative bifunctional diguanylate cyclase/phosphodiesterase n=1 Tax=Dasania marina TaxID=471499 RepID=UPI0030D75015